MAPDLSASFYDASTVDGDHFLSSASQIKDFFSTDWKWRRRTVQHVAIEATEKDQEPFLGTFCLLLYIGVWVFSTLALPAVLILLLLQCWIAAGITTTLILLCYAIPVHPNQSFRAFARTHFARYFKESSVRFEHVPGAVKDRPTILCINPHGVFSLSWAICFLTEELHHLTFCFSSLLRLNPFLRIITQLIGNPSDIKKETVLKHMKNGISIALIPGAWHEATIHNSRVDRLYIRKRQGFIKYALQFGFTITPTYCFGERMAYSNLQGGYSFRFWLNDHKISTTLAWGRWWCPILPRPVPIHTVIGAPIELPHIPAPTREDVDLWHKVYMDEMVDIFNHYKRQFYGEEGESLHLELW